MGIAGRSDGVRRDQSIGSRGHLSRRYRVDGRCRRFRGVCDARRRDGSHQAGRARWRRIAALQARRRNRADARVAVGNSIDAPRHGSVAAKRDLQLLGLPGRNGRASRRN